MTDIVILKPIIALLKSRKFIAGLASVIVAILVAYEPRLAHVADLLIALIIFVGLAFIGGTAWEDAAKAGKERASEPLGTPQDEIRKMILDILSGYEDTPQ